MTGGTYLALMWPVSCLKEWICRKDNVSSRSYCFKDDGIWGIMVRFFLLICCHLFVLLVFKMFLIGALWSPREWLLSFNEFYCCKSLTTTNIWALMGLKLLHHTWKSDHTRDGLSWVCKKGVLMACSVTQHFCAVRCGTNMCIGKNAAENCWARNANLQSSHLWLSGWRYLEVY